MSVSKAEAYVYDELQKLGRKIDEEEKKPKGQRDRELLGDWRQEKKELLNQLLSSVGAVGQKRPREKEEVDRVMEPSSPADNEPQPHGPEAAPSAACVAAPAAAAGKQRKEHAILLDVDDEEDIELAPDSKRQRTGPPALPVNERGAAANNDSVLPPCLLLPHWNEHDRRQAFIYLELRTAPGTTNSGCRLGKCGGAIKVNGVVYSSIQVFAFAAHHPRVPLQQNLAVYAKCGERRCITPECLRVGFSAVHGVQFPKLPVLHAADLLRLQREAKHNPCIAMQYQKIIPEKVHDLFKAGKFGELERWLKPLETSVACVDASAAAPAAAPAAAAAAAAAAGNQEEDPQEAMPALEAPGASAFSEAPVAATAAASTPVDDSTDDEVEEEQMVASVAGGAASTHERRPREKPITAPADWSAADFHAAQAYVNKNTASKKGAQGCRLWDLGTSKLARFRGVTYSSGQLLAFAAHNPDLQLKRGLGVEAKCGDPLCITPKCLRLLYKSPRGPKSAFLQTLTMQDIVSLQQRAKNDSRIRMQHENISLEKLNSLRDAGDFAGIQKWLKPAT
jgi:hypothetical protein